jgi:CDP-diacylglycerol---glycerol-3-phosphate 3-phosphatidyltransferase
MKTAMKTPGSSPEDVILTETRSFWYRQTPNLITSARIAAVPVVMWLVISFFDDPWLRLVSMVALIASASTDGLDGAIARKRNLVTNLGKILDPIADKALLGGALIALSWVGAVSWWATGLILARELAITLYRLAVIRKHVLPADTSGKVKTVIQIVAISIVMAPFDFLGGWWGWFAQFAIWFAVVVTWLTGLGYVLRWGRAEKQGG